MRDPLVAQGTNPLSTELKQNYNQRKSALLAEADRMPDAECAFNATPDTATFGSRVAHVADAQFMICSALKASFDYCEGAYASVTDSTATQKVMIFGRPQTKLSALWGNLGHATKKCTATWRCTCG